MSNLISSSSIFVARPLVGFDRRSWTPVSGASSSSFSNLILDLFLRSASSRFLNRYESMVSIRAEDFLA